MNGRRRFKRVLGRWQAMALGFVLFVAAACGGDAAEETADTDAGAAGSDSFRVVAYQGAEALGGEEIAFASLLGQGTPVVLNFWAALCPPCLAEMPWFDAVAREYEDRVLMVGVDIGPFIGLGTNEQGGDLLERLEIAYPAAYAVDDRPMRDFQVLGMPTTIFFDGDGEVIEKHTGVLTEQQIDDWFHDLAEGAR